MTLRARVVLVRPGIPLEDHAAIAGDLLERFLAECARAELAVVSKPRLSIDRQLDAIVIRNFAGDVVRVVPPLNAWKVEAHVAEA